MNLAEPARRVSPATCELAETVKALEHDDEYKVEPAVLEADLDGYKVEPAAQVDAAVTVDDAKKFAPMKQLNEPHRDESLDIPIEKLRLGGVKFEGPVAITKGLVVTFTRRTLGKIIPALYDDRDYVAYGEIERYVVVKDNTCLVYTGPTDSSPLYSIPIESLKAVREDPLNPHKRSLTVRPAPNSGLQGEGLETILLLDDNEKLAFQFTFDLSRGKSLADDFMAAVVESNMAAKMTEKKK